MTSDATGSDRQAASKTASTECAARKLRGWLRRELTGSALHIIDPRGTFGRSDPGVAAA